jgi:hypothetical protein
MVERRERRERGREREKETWRMEERYFVFFLIRDLQQHSGG